MIYDRENDFILKSEVFTHRSTDPNDKLNSVIRGLSVLCFILNLNVPAFYTTCRGQIASSVFEDVRKCGRKEAYNKSGSQYHNHVTVQKRNSPKSPAKRVASTSLGSRTKRIKMQLKEIRERVPITYS